VYLRTISLDDGVGIALESIFASRLVLLCGAGLSMSSPSNLPSAAALAASAKKKYAARFGVGRPPLADGIEEQAEFFFERGDLGTLYLKTLIDADAFASPFNEGHSAVADLLLTGSACTAVSTNVDTLIEDAGHALFGQIRCGIDREAVAGLPNDVSPLLKIHGCWRLDQTNTVWASGQLTTDPVMSRVNGSAAWLNHRLVDKDLVVIGYFTDWDYLNGVLEKALGEVSPSRVVVVDRGDGDWLAAKAPVFNALGNRARSEFLHVQATGNDFLQTLRLRFCQSFVRGVVHAGADAFAQLYDRRPDPSWLEPSAAETSSLYALRRDLEGVLPNEPARRREPADGPAVGLTILELLNAGASSDGQYWLLNGKRIRVLNSGNQLLRGLEIAYGREAPPLTPADMVIAVGAETDTLVAHVVRGGTAPTVARGTSGVWLTLSDAFRELGL